MRNNHELVANSLSGYKYCHHAKVWDCLDLRQNVEAVGLAKVMTTQLNFVNMKNLKEFAKQIKLSKHAKPTIYRVMNFVTMQWRRQGGDGGRGI